MGCGAPHAPCTKPTTWRGPLHPLTPWQTPPPGCRRSRVRSGAPDADASLAALERARGKVMEFGALMLLTGNERTLQEVLVYALDIDDPSVPQEERESRVPAAQVPIDHWMWATRQLQLDHAQVRARALKCGFVRVRRLCASEAPACQQRRYTHASQ